IRLLSKLRALFNRHHLERDLDDEIRSHIDLATEEYIRDGLPPDEARRRARIKFGSTEASKDAHRDARGIDWVDGLIYDLRFALRGLVRSPGFSATAVLMLSIAIGLN